MGTRTTRQVFLIGCLATCLAACLAVDLSAQESTATSQVDVRAPHPQIPPDESFPDGISPSHVFAKLDRVDRSLDELIKVRNITMPTFPEQVETRLAPMHVYQTVLSCLDRLQQLDDQHDVFAVPTITVRPRIYAPRDVFFVVTTMLDNIQRVGRHLKVDTLPTDESAVAGKTATDVFGLAVRVFVKLNALCGNSDLRPAEVYAQMIRGVEDVKSILRQNDPACRYRINSPASPKGRTPADVFQKCLDIRKLVNRYREELDMEVTPVATTPSGTVRPRDVFFQTQIIIAELNLLKMRMHTISSTPLPIPVGNETTPTDVHNQASMLEFLLEQVESVGKQKQTAS